MDLELSRVAGQCEMGLTRPQINLLAYFGLLLLLFFGFIIGMKIYVRTERFKKQYLGELAFLTGGYHVRMEVGHVQPLGLFSFKMSKVRFFTYKGKEDETILSLESLYVSPRLRFFPPSIDRFIDAKIDDERQIIGVDHTPLFRGKGSYKRVKKLDAFPRELNFTYTKAPIQLVLGFLEDRISSELAESLTGEATGTFAYRMRAPFDLSGTDIEASFEISNMQVASPQRGDLSANEKSVVFDTFASHWELDNEGYLQLTEALVLSSKQKRGRVQLEGGILLQEEDGEEPELAIQMSGDSELFIFLKKFFHCPIDKQNVTLRGFKILSCS